VPIQLGDPILSTLFRDPWLIPIVDSYAEFVERIKEFALIAKGLIGEVFKEEEREAAHRPLLQVNTPSRRRHMGELGDRGNRPATRRTGHHR